MSSARSSSRVGVDTDTDTNESRTNRYGAELEDQQRDLLLLDQLNREEESNMFSLKSMRWKVIGAAATLSMLTTAALAQTSALDLGNGARVAAVSDASSALPGNPDNPPKSEIAFANLVLGADGRFSLGP